MNRHTYFLLSFTEAVCVGFCTKNDSVQRNVGLLVEAFRVLSDERFPHTKGEEPLGEGRLIVFPRAEVPHEDIPVSAGREIYSMTDVMSLAWATGKKDTATNNAGHVKFSAVLRYSLFKGADPHLPNDIEKTRLEQLDRLADVLGLSPVTEELSQVIVTITVLL